jgi:hypothetical protein
MKQPFWNNKPIRPNLPRITLVAPGGLESSYYGTDNGLDLTQDGRYLKVHFFRDTAKTTNYIYVYDTLNGSLIRTLTSGTTLPTVFSGSSMCANTNNYIAAYNMMDFSVYGSQKLDLYDWSNGSLLRSWTQGTHYNGRINSVKLNANGTRVMIATNTISGSTQWGVYVFNTSTGATIYSRLFNPNFAFTGATISPSGNKVSYLYYVDVAPFPNNDENWVVSVWDVNTGTKNLETTTLVPGGSTVQAWPALGWYNPVIFDNNDEYAMIGGRSEKRIYKLSDASLVRSFTVGTGSGSLPGQSAMVQTWSLDNTKILMGSTGTQTTKNGIVFDALYGTVLGNFSPTTTTGITSVATNYDGSIIALGAYVSGVFGQSCVYIY